MKTMYCILTLSMITSLSKATVHTVDLNSSTGITPSTVNAAVGDTIKWVTSCACPHTTVSTTIPTCATAWNHTFQAVIGATY